MSLESCIRSAKKWVGENSDVKLSSAELEQVGRLLNAAESMGATPAEKTALMQSVLDRKLEVEQAIRRAVFLKNALTQEKTLGNVTANGEAWATGSGRAEPKTGAPKGDLFAEAMSAQIQGGSTRPGVESNMDPYYMKASVKGRLLSFAQNVFTPSEWKILQGLRIEDPLSRDTMLELGALRAKTQLGTTNNDIALSLAKGIRKVQDYSLQELKGVNPYFTENEDFLLSRIHDREKMMAVSKNDWVKTAMQRFSGSFVGMDDAEKYRAFGDIYDGKKSGRYVPSEASRGDAWAPKGTGKNQGLASAPRRVLVASSPLDEWKYAAQFGQDIFPTIMQGIDDRAQTVATVQKWGLHTADNFNTLLGKVTDHLKDDPEAQAQFLTHEKELRNKFEATQVRSSNIATNWKGRWLQNAMAVENASKLGMHVPRSLNSWQTAITLTRDITGRTLPEVATDLASKMAENFAPGSNGGREAGLHLGLSLHSFAADLMGQTGAAGNLKPGMLAEGMQSIGKMTGTDRFVTSGKVATAQFVSRELGSLADTSFEKLTVQQKETLMRYGLHGEKWDAIRQAVATDGPLKGAITPEAIRGLTDEQVRPAAPAGATPRDLEAARSDMATGLSTYFNDVAGLTMAESNTRSRYAAYGLASPSDSWGIARRMMMQFKQAALIQQQLTKRVYQSGGGGTSNLSGVFTHVAGAAFLGMVGQYVIDAATGKAPASPGSPEMLARAGLNGLGAGVVGDALFHALAGPSGMKTSGLMLADLAGPVVGDAGKALDASMHTLRGIHQSLEGTSKENQYGGKEWAQLIHSLTPGQNIFYTKAAMDYLLMNELHSFMGGYGYLGALQKSAGHQPAWPEALGGPGGQRQLTFGGRNFWE